MPGPSHCPPLVAPLWQPGTGVPLFALVPPTALPSRALLSVS